jgi:hypothetical protein
MSAFKFTEEGEKELENLKELLQKEFSGLIQRETARQIQKQKRKLELEQPKPKETDKKTKGDLIFTRIHLTRDENEYAEGYWQYENDDQDSKFPFPVEATKTEWESFPVETFTEKLRRIEVEAKKTGKSRGEEATVPCNIHWRGISTCRLCKERNGSLEYYLGFYKDGTHRTLKWPSGFLHYIEKHHVLPCKEFYDVITNYEL